MSHKLNNRILGVFSLFGDTIPEITYTEYSSGFNWGFAQEFYLKKLCSTISESINLQGLKNKSTGFSEYSELNLTECVDNVIEFLHSFKNKKYWTIITDSEKGIGIWLNQDNEFCRFQDIRKDDNIPEKLKELAASNKHVAHNFKYDLYSLNAIHSSYLETKAITIEEIGEFIDAKIKDYDGDKQDKDFAALIFTIGELCSKYPNLS